MSGHGLKLFGPGGRFFYRKKRQLRGGGAGGGMEESGMIGGQRTGASRCQNTALAISFEILSTHPLELALLKENQKTAAQKIKKKRNNNKKGIKEKDQFIFYLNSPEFME